MSSTKFCEDYGSIYWLMKWRTFTNRSEINKQIIFFFHQQQAIFITISQDRPESCHPLPNLNLISQRT